MNVNNQLGLGVVRSLVGLTTACFVLSFSSTVLAEQGLNASSQTKVNNAKAKAWGRSDGSKDGYEQMDAKRIVNLGSRRGGNCSVNVGTAEPGKKAPKEIVVTTKEVINVCK